MLLYILLFALPALTLQASLKPYDHTAMQLFRFICIDNSGRISPQEQHNYFTRYDRDNNGQISRQEFSTEIDAEDSHFRGHEAQMFDIFDVNADNHLTESDFLHIFNINDFNDDGEVSMHEFVTYWEKVFEAFEDKNGK